MPTHRTPKPQGMSIFVVNNEGRMRGLVRAARSGRIVLVWVVTAGTDARVRRIVASVLQPLARRVHFANTRRVRQGLPPIVVVSTSLTARNVRPEFAKDLLKSTFPPDTMGDIAVFTDAVYVSGKKWDVIPIRGLSKTGAILEFMPSTLSFVDRVSDSARMPVVTPALLQDVQYARLGFTFPYTDEASLASLHVVSEGGKGKGTTDTTGSSGRATSEDTLYLERAALDIATLTKAATADGLRETLTRAGIPASVVAVLFVDLSVRPLRDAGVSRAASPGLLPVVDLVESALAAVLHSDVMLERVLILPWDVARLAHVPRVALVRLDTGETAAYGDVFPMLHKLHAVAVTGGKQRARRRRRQDSPRIRHHHHHHHNNNAEGNDVLTRWSFWRQDRQEATMQTPLRLVLPRGWVNLRLLGQGAGMFPAQVAATISNRAVSGASAAPVPPSLAWVRMCLGSLVAVPTQDAHLRSSIRQLKLAIAFLCGVPGALTNPVRYNRFWDMDHLATPELFTQALTLVCREPQDAVALYTVLGRVTREAPTPSLERPDSYTPVALCTDENADDGVDVDVKNTTQPFVVSGRHLHTGAMFRVAAQLQPCNRGSAVPLLTLPSMEVADTRYVFPFAGTTTDAAAADSFVSADSVEVSVYMAGLRYDDTLPGLLSERTQAADYVSVTSPSTPSFADLALTIRPSQLFFPDDIRRNLHLRHYATQRKEELTSVLQYFHSLASDADAYAAWAVRVQEASSKGAKDQQQASVPQPPAMPSAQPVPAAALAYGAVFNNATLGHLYNIRQDPAGTFGTNTVVLIFGRDTCGFTQRARKTAAAARRPHAYVRVANAADPLVRLSKAAVPDTHTTLPVVVTDTGEFIGGATEYEAWERRQGAQGEAHDRGHGQGQRQPPVRPPTPADATNDNDNENE